jgi:hypothetical protein
MAEDKKEKKIVKTFADALVKDMAKAIPSASGKTAKSLRTELTPNGFVIYGGEQIGAIIDGRKPTKNGAPKGNPTLQEEIFSWIKSRSIRPKESNMSQVSLSWVISRSIHKKGYKGKGNIFKELLSLKNFSSLTSMLAQEKAITIQSSIINQYKRK